LNGRAHSRYGARLHRKQAIHGLIFITGAALIIALGWGLSTRWQRGIPGSRTELRRLWADGDWEAVFERSGELLRRSPVDYEYLTLRGFASYQLAIAQINTGDTLSRIDTCIWALRRALLVRDRKKGKAPDGALCYVLGKAYSYKGESYADLSVKYLEKARAASYSASDIPEYLGLAYAALQDYHASVAAFTEALDGEGREGDEEPPDLLLLAIARSYMALGEQDTAKAYLLRCVETSRDSLRINDARLLLGEILSGQGDTEGALAQYGAVLAEDSGNADALYRMGELYAAQGNAVKARAQWRQAVKINPGHKEARARLGLI